MSENEFPVIAHAQAPYLKFLDDVDLNLLVYFPLLLLCSDSYLISQKNTLNNIGSVLWQNESLDLKLRIHFTILR